MHLLLHKVPFCDIFLKKFCMAYTACSCNSCTGTDMLLLLGFYGVDFFQTLFAFICQLSFSAEFERYVLSNSHLGVKMTVLERRHVLQGSRSDQDMTYLILVLW